MRPRHERSPSPTGNPLKQTAQEVTAKLVTAPIVPPQCVQPIGRAQHLPPTACTTEPLKLLSDLRHSRPPRLEVHHRGFGSAHLTDVAENMEVQMSTLLYPRLRTRLARLAALMVMMMVAIPGAAHASSCPAQATTTPFSNGGTPGITSSYREATSSPRWRPAAGSSTEPGARSATSRSTWAAAATHIR